MRESFCFTVKVMNGSSDLATVTGSNFIHLILLTASQGGPDAAAEDGTAVDTTAEDGTAEDATAELS